MSGTVVPGCTAITVVLLTVVALPVESNTASEYGGQDAIYDYCFATFTFLTGYSPEDRPLCHGYKQDTNVTVLSASPWAPSEDGMPMVDCADGEPMGSVCAIGFDMTADNVARGAHMGTSDAVTFGSDYPTATEIYVESKPAGCYRVYLQIRNTTTDALSYGYVTPDPLTQNPPQCGPGGSWLGVECIGPGAGQGFTYQAASGYTIERIAAIRFPELTASDCASHTLRPRAVRAQWSYDDVTTTSDATSSLIVVADTLDGGCLVSWSYEASKTAATFGRSKGAYVKNGEFQQLDQASGTGTQTASNSGHDHLKLGEYATVFATAWSHGDAGAESIVASALCTNP